MTPNTFWQINAGQLATIIGLVGSAFIFLWRTASIHGRHQKEVETLMEKVDEHDSTIDEHSATINELKALVGLSEQRLKTSEERLKMLEQEMQDIHRHGLALTAPAAHVVVQAAPLQAPQNT